MKILQELWWVTMFLVKVPLIIGATAALIWASKLLF
jgi:hypothetical protein